MSDQLIIGQPVKPMLVKESGTDEKKFGQIIKKHNGLTLAEIKSDGYRVQVHKNEGIKLFTRSLNEMNPEVFPDLTEQLNNLPQGIYDGELVGIEDGINGFNAVKERVRKTLDQDKVNQYPVKINFFDILNLEGHTLTSNPLTERRRTLENFVYDNLSTQWQFDEPEVLQEKFNETVDLGLEGLVCKNPESEYVVGGRNNDWIKLKGFLTLDLTILGIYKGESGRVAELPFAAVLLGAYNPLTNNYETITKVGLTGKDKVEAIYERIAPACTQDIPENIIMSEAINKKTYARKVPFNYVQPERSLVLETQCLNVTYSKNWHSCGFENGYAHSLRIPSVKEIRYDKKPTESNTTQQISEIYNK